jgi:glycosyltransferase involved in cell wall biosynthesis
MRIALLTSLWPAPDRPREGIFAEERWRRMVARGHEVRVVRPVPWWPGLLAGLPLVPRSWREHAGEPRRESRAGIEVRRPRYLHWPHAPRGNARRFARCAMADLARLPEPDVVVADYAWPAAMAAAACRARGAPFVVHGRGSDVLQVREDPALRPLLEDAVKTAGQWCAVSRDLVAALDMLGGAPGRGALVPNGVDGAVYAPQDRVAARASLGLALDRPLVLVVGHWIERKDPLLALEAVAALSGVELALVGRGPLEEALRHRAARADLAGRVRFVGELPPAELARWYAACDALLLASRREGRPNVVLEALSCGRPVVACAAGGTAELLAAAPRMLVVGREPALLAERLRATLAAPPSPEECRALVRHLDWDACLDALEGVLARAIAEAARA